MIRARDLQALHRLIYEAEGLDRTKATLEEKHQAQRRYDIKRTLVGFRAVLIKPEQNSRENPS